MKNLLRRLRLNRIDFRTSLCFLTIGILMIIFFGCESSEGSNDHDEFSEELKKQIIDEIIEARTALQTIVPVSRAYGEFSIDEAYKLQNLLTEELEAKHGPVTGYKIGFATPEDFSRLGIDEPVWGRLYSGYELKSGDTIYQEDYVAGQIENELVIIIDKRIDVHIESREQLRPFIRSVHTGFDIADNIYDKSNDIKVADLVANGVGASGYVIGPAVELDDISDLDELIITILKNGENIYEGPSTEVFESPWNIMIWLANDLLSRGHFLEAGDIILTGKVAPEVALSGNEAKGEYVGTISEPFGRITITVE